MSLKSSTQSSRPLTLLLSPLMLTLKSFSFFASDSFFFFFALSPKRNCYAEGTRVTGELGRPGGRRRDTAPS